MKAKGIFIKFGQQNSASEKEFNELMKAIISLKKFKQSLIKLDNLLNSQMVHNVVKETLNILDVELNRTKARLQTVIWNEFEYQFIHRRKI